MVIRHYRAHFDVTVMKISYWLICCTALLSAWLISNSAKLENLSLISCTALLSAWLIPNSAKLESYNDWHGNQSLVIWPWLNWVWPQPCDVKSTMQMPSHLFKTGWETKIFRHSPELGSLLYSLYKIPLAQACFPLTRPNFHSHWRAGER